MWKLKVLISLLCWLNNFSPSIAAVLNNRLWIFVHEYLYQIGYLATWKQPIVYQKWKTLKYTCFRAMEPKIPNHSHSTFLPSGTFQNWWLRSWCFPGYIELFTLHCLCVLYSNHSSLPSSNYLSPTFIFFHTFLSFNSSTDFICPFVSFSILTANRNMKCPSQITSSRQP